MVRLPYDKLTRLQAIHFSVVVVRQVLPIWEAHHPDDDRPHQIIRAVETADFTQTLSCLGKIGRFDEHERVYDVAVAAVYAAYTVTTKEDYVSYYVRRIVRHASEACSISSALQLQKLVIDLYSAIYRDGRVFPAHWKTPAVLSLQQVAKTDLSVFPILADALEEAGCQEEEILCHLRQRRDLWTPADWCLNNTGD